MYSVKYIILILELESMYLSHYNARNIIYINTFYLHAREMIQEFNSINALEILKYEMPLHLLLNICFILLRNNYVPWTNYL